MSYRLIEKQVIFSGEKVRLELHHLENEEGQRIRREVCVHPGALVILPILSDGRILLIRNRRYSLGGLILIELPAGTLEKNEDPMNCAGASDCRTFQCSQIRRQWLSLVFDTPCVESAPA